MSSLQGNCVWNDDDAEGRKSFVGYFQLFNGKNTTTLKSIALVSYLGLVLVINYSAIFRC